MAERVVPVSKRLAELMGGTMWIQREPGRGSTFHFTVVVEPREAPANAQVQGAQA